MFLLFLSLGAQAQGTACLHAPPTQVELQVWSPEGWISIADPQCAEDKFVRTMARALTQLQELPSLPPLQGAWQSNILGSSPWNFFKQNVQTVRLDTDPLSLQCPNNQTVVLAFVNGLNPKTITLCPSLQWVTTIDIMSTLLHEARHLPTDASKVFEPAHPHIICSSGALKNSFACDEHYTDGGSYAANMEFLLKLSRSANVPLDLQTQARASAMSYALNHFNQLPLGKNQGMILIDAKQSVYFYDLENTQLHFLTAAPDSTSFSTLRYIPTFFNSQKGEVSSFNGGDFFSRTEGVMAEKFRQLPLEARQTLKDIYYGNSYACFLYEQRLECEGDQATISLPLPEKAVQFTPVYELFNGSDLVHIVGASGTLYLLPTIKPVADWQVSDLQETKSFRNFLSVAIFPQLDRYALTLEGEVVHIESSANLPVAGLKGQRFQKMMGPYYWSLSLEEL